MNYGEEIAYWFLRFNGFIPMTNFVVHQEQGRKGSDTDILAVRHPYVVERIGGNPHDWDPGISQYWIGNHVVGVVGEVKSGRRTGELFPDHRLLQSIHRLGLVAEPEQLFQELRDQASAEAPGIRIIKLLVADTLPRQRDKFVCVRLDDAREFLIRRLVAYREKRGDWVYFHSNLMQELIFEAKRRWKDPERVRRHRG